MPCISTYVDCQGVFGEGAGWAEKVVGIAGSDAIHVASALSIGGDLEALITYDERLAQTAKNACARIIRISQARRRVNKRRAPRVPSEGDVSSLKRTLAAIGSPRNRKRLVCSRPLGPFGQRDIHHNRKAPSGFPRFQPFPECQLLLGSPFVTLWLGVHK